MSISNLKLGTIAKQYGMTAALGLGVGVGIGHLDAKYITGPKHAGHFAAYGMPVQGNRSGKYLDFSLVSNGISPDQKVSLSLWNPHPKLEPTGHYLYDENLAAIQRAIEMNSAQDSQEVTYCLMTGYGLESYKNKFHEILIQCMGLFRIPEYDQQVRLNVTAVVCAPLSIEDQFEGKLIWK